MLCPQRVRLQFNSDGGRKMRTTFGRLLAAATLSIGLISPALAQQKIQPAAAQAALDSGKVRVIVVTRADTRFRDGGNALRRPATYLAKTLGLKALGVKPIGQLPMATAVVTAEGLEALKDDPNVAYVVKDELRKPSLVDSVKLIGAAKHAEAGFGGKGVTVAILDSGIDRNHLAFPKAIRSEGCFSSTVNTSEGNSVSLCPGGEGRVYGKGAAAPCDMNFSDGCFHGTHVAGIVAGRAVELEDGRVVTGVAPEAGLIVAQVFSGFSGEACGENGGNCISAWDSDIIAALEWVYRKRDKFKIAAVNMSLGGGYFPQACDAESPYAEIFQRLRQANIAPVVAAGNESFKDGVSAPACNSAAISVSATSKDGKIDESYSNVAPTVTLAAFGSDIISAFPGNQYMQASGTSMAAPHVAGVFALLRQEFPDMSVNDMVKLLRKTGRTVKDSRTGTKLKRVDLARINPGGDDPVGTAMKMPLDAEDASFEQQAQLIASGDDTMRTVIVQSSLTAEEIKAKLGEACKDCTVEALGGSSFKLTVPAGLAKQLAGTGTLEAKLQNFIGGGAKVFRNRINKPMTAKTAQ